MYHFKKSHESVFTYYDFLNSDDCALMSQCLFCTPITFNNNSKDNYIYYNNCKLNKYIVVTLKNSYSLK